MDRDDGRGRPQHHDVLVVGAGLSGIGATHRLQQLCPERSWAILEARAAIGGTWDLFRYPGVRSDSDIASFSYPFRQWLGPETVADGASIRRYIEQTAAATGITSGIRFNTRVVAADWSSRLGLWTVRAMQHPDSADPVEKTLTCHLLYSCTGYYDHRAGYAPDLPGVSSYRGRVVHPQSWPDDLDHCGMRVVVIGSGATAVTLVPALARTAAHVTMLQRSPSWLMSVPSTDPMADRLNRFLPSGLVQRVVRTRNIAITTATYQFCRRRPQAAARWLQRPIAARLGERAVHDHFTPRYAPWDQRLCIMVDGDLVRAIRTGAADVVTDEVAELVPEGVRLASGRVLEADLIVTATGLRLQPLGDIQLRVDGRAVDLQATSVYRGLMLSGVPNFAFAMGYTNASWTLRADLSSRYVCRFLNHLHDHGYAYGVPVPPTDPTRRPLIGLTSGYVLRGVGAFPKQGSRPPWRVRQNYLLDLIEMQTARLGSQVRFVRPGSASPDRPDADAPEDLAAAHGRIQP